MTPEMTTHTTASQMKLWIWVLRIIIQINTMHKSILQNRLSALDLQYRRSSIPKRLRVFYGWAKINKIRKKEAISVIFENNSRKESQTLLFIKRMQTTVYVRDQTEGEMIGIDKAVRMYTEYSVFLSDHQGSLELALRNNSEADSKNVSEEERNLISSKLRKSYLESHAGYKEPAVQLKLF